VDNEQVENIIFSIRYSLQQLESRLEEKGLGGQADYFDTIAKIDNNMKVMLTAIQALQHDILQLRVAVGEIKSSPSQTVVPVLSPKTPVVANPEDATLFREKTSQAEIKWDKRASDIAPEESFGFKIPNAK